MASLLRQIVAGPRARHPEAGLDLCYVTDNIIATSGPSQTYPQRAYRNPLDRVVAFLDSKHDTNWAIWEFRAEGTGYPDDLVYNRIRHYPWPDHHPPPFRLIPMIMASMRNWINGNDLDIDSDNKENNGGEEEGKQGEKKKKLAEKIVDTWKEIHKTDRVVVVHCKAGKGRSGTIACSYLIAECGWSPEQALARFTERRMRPRMGPGVSIPSQLRTIGYVERWARQQGRRVYVDRPVEILEVHVWGLRNGVKIAVEGYADEGKKIKILHTFTKKERHVVDGEPPGGAGVVDMVYDMVGYNAALAVGATNTAVPEQEILDEARGSADKEEQQQNDTDTTVDYTTTPTPPDRTETPSSSNSVKSKMNKRASTLISKVSRSASKAGAARKSSPTTELDTKTVTSTPSTTATTSTSTVNGGSADPSTTFTSPSLSTTSTSTPLETRLKEQASQTQNSSSGTTTPTTQTEEPGGRAVIFKPQTPIRVPNSDVNITIERRNRAPRSVGLTMVTAVAHVWFNAFFEGNGPEQDGKADQNGVFEIEWDKLDGIKGSSQKGTRALEKVAVVWRIAGTGVGTGEGEGVGKREEGGVKEGETEEEEEGEGEGEIINQPSLTSPVPQMRPADWKGASLQDPDAGRHLGLRVQSPDSADVSQASSLRNEVVGEAERRGNEVEDDAELRSVRSDVGDGAGDDDGLKAYKDKLPSPEGSGSGSGR